MIKCKNCEFEFEKGKYCPNCGASVKDEKKSKAERAMELLESLDSRLSAMEQRETDRETAKAKRLEDMKKKGEKHGEDKPTSGSTKSRGFLDIF